MQSKPTGGFLSSLAAWHLGRRNKPPPPPPLQPIPELLEWLEPPPLALGEPARRLRQREVKAGGSVQARSSALQPHPGAPADAQGGRGPGEADAVAGGRLAPEPEAFPPARRGAESKYQADGKPRGESKAPAEAKARPADEPASLPLAQKLAPWVMRAMRSPEDLRSVGLQGEAAARQLKVAAMDVAQLQALGRAVVDALMAEPVRPTASFALMSGIEQSLPPGSRRDAWRAALLAQVLHRAETEQIGFDDLRAFGHALGNLAGGLDMGEPGRRPLVAGLVRCVDRVRPSHLLVFLEGVARSLGEPRLSPDSLRSLVRLPLALVSLREPEEMGVVGCLFTQAVGGHRLSDAAARVLMQALLEADDLPAETLGYMVLGIARGRTAIPGFAGSDHLLDPASQPGLPAALLAMARHATPAQVGRLLFSLATALRAQGLMMDWGAPVLSALAAGGPPWSALHVAAGACGLAAGASDGAPGEALEAALHAGLSKAKAGAAQAFPGLEAARVGLALAAHPLQPLFEEGLTRADRLALVELAFATPRVLDPRSMPRLVKEVLALPVADDLRADVMALLLRHGSAHLTPEMVELSRTGRGPDAGLAGRAGEPDPPGPLVASSSAGGDSPRAQAGPSGPVGQPSS